jgi:hypothetical protein
VSQRRDSAVKNDPSRWQSVSFVAMMLVIIDLLSHRQGVTGI